MFEKNLNDLVRGIRANKSNEAKYIAQCIEEIKHELRQDNANVKANAICKLIYLQMFGYDISWAAFNVIEVMSSTKFTHKRIGYLASSQCFTEDMDILTLTTNLIRKDFSSQNQYDAAVTLNGLSCFVSADLARDLANDVITLLASTKPYIRKRAIIVLYKIFLKFPEALRPAYPRLKAKLDDPEPSVQSAAVNVICELARKNPQNYLSLAPIFFKLMTNSTNNWMLIKIIKLFAALTPLEPRLGKKLIEPLTNLIHSTSAMSLLYECINTVIAVLLAFTSMPNHSASVQLCVSKLRLLIEDADQNLKYLGLLAMSKILKAHPKAVQAHKDMILRCLDDKDESIKLRALDLISGMISKKNLVEIVKKLMRHIETTESTSYRDELLSKIIHICSQSSYQYVVDFEWYISVLVELAQVDGIHHGSLIATQLLDVTVRVKGIRGFSVQQMTMLLQNSKLMGTTTQGSSTGDVFFAAAWIVGEFSEHLSDLQGTMHIFLQPRATSLPPSVQAVVVHNIIKLYSRVYLKAESDNDQESIDEVTQMLIDKLPMFGESGDLEVQERACCAIQMLKYIQKIREKGLTILDEVREMFAGELNPVAAKAQKKVPVPEGLNLDVWINDPPSDSSDDEFNNAAMFVTEEDQNVSNMQGKKYPQVDEDELKKRREARKLEQENNPYYIKGNTKSKESEGPDISNIPVASLDLSVPLKVPGKEITKKSKKKKKKGRKHDVDEEADTVVATLDINTDMGEMPEGAVSTDDEAGKDNKDPYNFLNVDLEKPLTEADMIPVPRHHEAVNKPISDEDTETTKEKLKKSKKKKDKGKKKEKKSSESKKNKDNKKKGGDKIVTDNKDVNDSEEAKDANLISDEAATISETLQNARSDTAKEIEKVTEKMDDINFWLSSNDNDVATLSAPAGDGTVSKTTITQDTTIRENDVNEKVKKGKKERKHKKKGKRPKPSEPISQNIAENPSEPNDLVEISTEQLPEYTSSYVLLGESEHLRMTFKTQVDPQFRNKVIVGIIFSNKTDSVISSLEFNVLDTLNTKLERPINVSAAEAIPVPFQLLPKVENECQFAFDVQSIVMPQKLRGTLTYMYKNDEGTSHEKIDFKLALPCSSYLYPENCSRKDFTEILTSGILHSKQSIKIKLNDGSDFRSVLGRLCSLLHASVIEQVDGGASLYASSIQRHHICLLVKNLATNTLTVDAKSAESMLLSHLLDEVKSAFS